MNINEIMKHINGEIKTKKDHINLIKDYTKAFACDLMSDCLAFVNENCILITGLTNNQSLRTAEMLDIDLIIIVRGKKPSLEMLELANEHHMTIMTTQYTMYETSGILYQAGIEALKIMNSESAYV